MTNRQLLNIIEEMGKNGGPKIGEIAAKAGLNRSHLSTFINLEEEKQVTNAMLRKLKKAYPKQFPETNKSNDGAANVLGVDKQTIVIDHTLFLQLIAEKEARRLDAEEKAKQAREDLNEVKEEKKELMGIIKENLTALLISSNAARQDLAKILLVNRVDDGKIMDNQDIAAGREVGSSAKEAGMLELTTESAALLENRKQNEKGKRVRVRK